MEFQIIGAIRAIQTIARGHEIRERKRLCKAYGNAHWRKLKGITRIRFNDGTVREAELHWYEAAGIGRKEFKLKSFLD